MKSHSETGHAKNVANFEDLISFCVGYGATYNPSKNELKIPALNSLFGNAQNKIDEVTSSKNAFDTGVGIRIDAFKPIKQLATRIINALDATDATNEVVKDAKTINRKIQGSSPKPKETPNPLPDAQDKKSISTSQQSYDRLIDSMSKLIDLVKSEVLYDPNEAELKNSALSNKLTELKTANTNVVNLYTVYSNAIINRDKALYLEPNNLVDTAQNVKKYVKSVFNATAPEYKQISGIEFKRPLKK